MHFLSGEQWKTLRQVEAHLIAEYREGASAGAIGFFCAMLQHVLHEV